MKKIILYNPAISSMNIGDGIIGDAVKDNLEEVLEKAFVVEVSTHLPMSLYYMRYMKDYDLKFVCGSNLLKSTFLGFKKQWDVNIRLSKIIGPTILVGAGWWQYGNKMNLYTKILLKSILSDKYIHSVRDSYTEKMLKSIGINNVLNTACPTMWKLTEQHCSRINKKKSENVVITLTDYNRNRELDEKMLNIVKENYKKVYFWPQGEGDYNYIKEFKSNDDNIIILSPTLKAFNEILKSENIDYIGTRLHGGIRALQKGVRAIIIAIDNRAIEKQKAFNLPIILRDEIELIQDKFINAKFDIEIKIPEENIKRWKGQFYKNEA